MADDDSLKFRISKKAYIFDIRKRYENIKGYSVKKPKIELTGKSILSQVFGVQAGKKKTGAGEKKAMQEKPSAPPSSGTLKSILISAAAFVIIIFAIALFVSASAKPASPPAKADYSPWIDFQVTDSQILSFGESAGQHVAYLEIPYNQKDLSSAKLTVKLFADPVPKQAFVLQTKRQQAESYPEFRQALSSGLSERGVSVSDISYAQLKSLPQNTLLIIPSGYFPQKLFEKDFSYQDLLSRGVVIVYIGLQFDRLLNDEGFPVSPTQAILSGIPFSFDKPQSSKDGFSLFDPQYTAIGRGGYGGAKPVLLYGSVSALKIDSGYMIFLPQTLDGGWRRGGKTAGADISRLILDSPWQPQIGSGELALEVQNSSSGTAHIYTSPFAKRDVFASIYLDGQSADGKKVSKTESAILKKIQNSNIYIKGGNSFSPTYLTGQKVRLTIDLSEPAGGERKLFLQTIRDGRMIKSDRIQEGATSLQSPVPFDYDSSLPAGKYALRTVDSTGRIYAQAQAEVSDFEVLPSPDFKKGNFTFAFSSRGSPVQPRPLKISVDGKFPFDSPGGAFVSYYIPNLQPGPHTFTFEFEGGFKKTLQLNYVVQKQFYENPMVVFLGIVTVVLFIAGTYLRRPEKQLYALDIPDFPPISQIKIPVKKAAVLSLFDSVNKAYAWQYMPLTIEDLKGGFRKLNHNGNAIIIGDYNLERLLSKIHATSGEVKEVMGLWCLRRWESESGRQLENLAAFRQMRDIFVNKAVKFSRPKEPGGEDAKIRISNRDYNLYIFDGDLSVQRALSTLSGAQSVLVFENEGAMRDFSRKLLSTSPMAVQLKLEISSQRAYLISIGKLSEFIDSMTV